MELTDALRTTLHAGFITVFSGLAVAQNFPVKPIRLVTSPPGGGNDFTARLIAQGVADGSLGQPMVVDNRPAALAAESVWKSPPDGYSLLVGGSTFMIGHLLRDTPYDPQRDFTPVILAGSSPNVVVIHPSLPVKNVRDLIALAKTRRGELNYGGAGLGGTQFLSTELFKSMTGVDIVYVAFKGAGPSVIGLLAGEIQVMFISANSVMAHVKAGRLRALAVTSAQPSALVPDLPTVAASGVPGYDVVSVDAVYAPAGTLAAVVNRLNQEISRAINKPDLKRKFLEAGTEIVGGAPEVLGAKLKSEISIWGKLIEAKGLREK